MANIFVNGELILKNSNNNIESIINNVLKMKKFKDYHLDTVYVDDKKVALASNGLFQNKLLDKYPSSISFHLNENYLVLSKSIDSCIFYLNMLSKYLEKLDLTNKQSQSILNPNNMANLLEIIDLFLSCINIILNNLSPRKKKSILIIQFETLSVIKAIHNASTNNDLVMLCDLIQYELKDILIKWKIKIVPTLKQMSYT